MLQNRCIIYFSHTKQNTACCKTVVLYISRIQNRTQHVTKSLYYIFLGYKTEHTMLQNRCIIYFSPAKQNTSLRYVIVYIHILFFQVVSYLFHLKILKNMKSYIYMHSSLFRSKSTMINNTFCPNFSSETHSLRP